MQLRRELEKRKNEEEKVRKNSGSSIKSKNNEKNVESVK